ncbi:hypothetical protein GQ600_23481 [Phytophthora cactorum]|nr:hypothetical protein GQ600_23481 [Phytophthora cactorum]
MESLPLVTPVTTETKTATILRTVRCGRKKQWVAAQVYGAVRFIPPTSNAVERLFSKARHVLSLHRHNMLPIRLEMLMLL